MPRDLTPLRNVGFSGECQFVTFCNLQNSFVDFQPIAWHFPLMEQRPIILIVEDDEEIRTLVSDYLRINGFDVEGARHAGELDQLLARVSPDLIVLDIMLPGGEDGLSICRRLRAQSSIPIIMLTARGDDIDRIVGIEIGADDYIAKPFNPRELSARIRAVLRRSAGLEKRPDNEVRAGHLIINYDRREVRADGGPPLDLSSGEYALLTVFLSRPQRVLDRDLLLELASGRSTSGVFDRAIDVQVSRLRKKIERDPANPELIKTVRNGGYIFACKVITP